MKNLIKLINKENCYSLDSENKNNKHILYMNLVKNSLKQNYILIIVIIISKLAKKATKNGYIKIIDRKQKLNNIINLSKL